MPAKPRLYALLVGINTYRGPVPALAGCRSDVSAMRDWLEADLRPVFDVQIVSLLDHEATRSEIIRQFRTHLGQARAGDSVLFHFSGHGSREKAPSAFRSYFPEEKYETLVCHDSRDGGYDLADKELAVLLYELHQRESQLTVVVDACHSGSVTRGPAIRHAETGGYTRPFDSYLEGYFAEQQRKEGRIDLPLSRHILLSACERRQQAYETEDHRGLFTSNLLHVLGEQPDLSYADLYVATRSRLRSQSALQQPRFEAYGNFNAYQTFLRQTQAQRRDRQRIYFVPGFGWQMDLGAVNGLPVQGSAPVELALYAPDETTPTALAQVAQVFPQRSRLYLNKEQDTGQTWEGELTSLPVPPLPVWLSGEQLGCAYLRQALLTDATHPVTVVDDPALADYHCRADEDRLLLLHGPTGELIQGAMPAGKEAVDYLASVLRRIRRWEDIAALQNPTPRLDPEAIDWVFYELDGAQEIAHREQGVVSCSPDDKGVWRVAYRMEVANNSRQLLYFYLVYLSPAYGVTPFPEAAFELEAGSKRVVSRARLRITEPDAQEELDRFQLFVSTEPLDDFLLQQEDLKLGLVKDFGIQERSAAKGLDWDEAADEGPVRDDWFVKRMNIRLVRHENRIADREVSLAGDALRIGGHPAFRAELSLQGSQTRGLEGSALAGLQRQLGLELLSVGGGTRSASGGNMLELSQIQEPDSVTPEQPLRLSLATPLAAGEQILPLAFDGVDFIPVGEMVPGDDGRVHLDIHRIPEEEVATRSLGRALKLAFCKLALGKTGSDLYQLRRVRFEGDEPVYHEIDPAQDIAPHSRFLLLIHGIIGNTIEMAKAFRPELAAEGQPGRYDVLLTFDYENLNTPIEKIALQLKTQLRTVGLDEQTKADPSPKQLDVVAHSMGGLVSRWFIEREQGDQVVGRLIMAGTPNGGSRFANIASYRDLLMTGLIFSLNIPALRGLLPWAAGAIAALKGSQQVTYTLAQMHPTKSDFLDMLNNSPDPKVPYYILAGDTTRYMPSEQAFMARLMDKALVGIGDLFNKDVPNDIAVAVDSITAIPARRQPAPQVAGQVCHHLNYFAHAESMTVLRGFLAADSRGR
ncbi:MAG: hypothetical protein OHK0039_07150 [Bacteroidia bacterium]